MNKIIDQLSSLTPNKYFFRVVGVIFLVVILIWQFPWMERILERMLSFPDLRHQVSVNISKSRKIFAKDELSLQILNLLYGGYRVLNPYSCLEVIQEKPFLVEMHCLPEDANQNYLDAATLTVGNEGVGIAENVLIHINVKHGGSIANYKVDSQEEYQIKTIDLENGVVNIWLERIASGASVHIELMGTGFVTNTISLSAVSDQGSSVPLDSTSFSGQVNTYATTVTGLFGEAGKVIWELPSIQSIRSWVSTKQIFVESFEIINGQEFQTVSLAALIIIFFIVIFLPDGFVFVIPFIVGFIVWLFFDIQVPAWWTLAPITVILALLITGLGSIGGARFGIASLIVSLAVGGWFIWESRDDTISIRWILSVVMFFLTLIMILPGIILLLGEEQKESNRNSGSQPAPQRIVLDTPRLASAIENAVWSQPAPQRIVLDTGTASQHELRQALDKKENDYNFLHGVVTSYQQDKAELKQEAVKLEQKLEKLEKDYVSLRERAIRYEYRIAELEQALRDRV